jgi:potassium/hydrogen antiporter
MDVGLEYITLAASILIFCSILASKFAFRLKIPYLLLLLLIGMLAGSEGIGGIEFEDYQLARNMGEMALIFILFSGAIVTNLQNVKSILWEGISLSTVGILTSTLIFAAFCHVILKFSLVESLLLGAIVSSTDAASVFSILKSYKGHIPQKLKTIIEFESGSNDPMSILLTMSFIYIIINPHYSIEEMIDNFIEKIILSTSIGFLIGNSIPMLINALKLEYESLYPALTIGTVFLLYGITQCLGGSGFLAVYVAGLFMGQKEFSHKQNIIRFHEDLTWLMQIAIFLALGLLVFPHKLLLDLPKVLLMSLILMLIARPLSVLFALGYSSKFTLREQFVISCAGIRGAVPIILATFPLAYEINRANVMFHTVFCIVLTSILVQGSLLLRTHKLLKTPHSL